MRCFRFGFSAAAAEAGGDATLWYNVFGLHRPTRRQRIEIASVLEQLRCKIRDGRIPLGGSVVGWPGVAGIRPPHAADTTDAAVMGPWFGRAHVIVLSWDEMAAPAMNCTTPIGDAARRTSLTRLY